MKRTVILVMTILTALSLLFVSACGKAPAEEKEAPEATASAAQPTPSASETQTAAEEEEPYYGIATTAPRADVEKFAAEVKQLFLQKDWETLSGMMDYPVRLFGETDANNKEEFLAAMNGHEFPDSSFKAMENEPCDDLFANGQGIMLADGLIWFRDVNYDGITQNGTPSFKIITVNTI